MGGQRNKQWNMMGGWLSHLLIIMVVLKSLVPVGYMPDFSKGFTASTLVICSASGPKIIDWSQIGDPTGEHQSTPSDDSVCPFAAWSDNGLVKPDHQGLPSLEFATVWSTAVPSAVLPPARAGPAVGSRAPPTHSDC